MEDKTRSYSVEKPEEEILDENDKAALAAIAKMSVKIDPLASTPVKKVSWWEKILKLFNPKRAKDAAEKTFVSESDMLLRTYIQLMGSYAYHKLLDRANTHGRAQSFDLTIHSIQYTLTEYFKNKPEFAKVFKQAELAELEIKRLVDEKINKDLTVYTEQLVKSLPENIKNGVNSIIVDEEAKAEKLQALQEELKSVKTREEIIVIAEKYNDILVGMSHVPTNSDVPKDTQKLGADE